MAIKLAAGALVLVLLAVLLQGSFLGGGGERDVSVLRPSSIPTATPPANLPEPILLGEIQNTQGGARPATGGGAGVYVVKSGDTLGAIAASQGVAADQQAAWIAEILRLNGIEDARLLRAGQELTLPRIPTQAAAQTTGTPRPPGTPGAGTPTRPPGTQIGASTPSSSGASGTATPRPTVASGASGTYTVQENDFPLSIAQKLGVPESQQLQWAQQLLTLNNVEASGLRVGQTLQLPPIPSGGSSSPSASPTRAP